MPLSSDVYINCDILDKIPQENRENWLFELKILQEELPPNGKILQVGSMDGTRALELLKVRPDLKITGLEIDEYFVKLSRENVKDATFIHGDITSPPPLENFDYVICLNNTLGYIEEDDKAIKEMKKLGKPIISVYGEKFTDQLAAEYFQAIHLEIEQITAQQFVMKDFTNIRRYNRNDVNAWQGKIMETPIGYCCFL